MPALPPNDPDLSSPDEQVPGAFGGIPRLRKAKKKTKTRRQLAQAVRAELAFAREMRKHWLEALVRYRATFLESVANIEAGKDMGFNQVQAATIAQRWPFLTERDPTPADALGPDSGWAEHKYRKLAAEFEHHYGPLPEDLKLEEYP